MGSHFFEVHDVHSVHMAEMIDTHRDLSPNEDPMLIDSIVSCLIMDILRRNAFVSPHDFDWYLGPCRPSEVSDSKTYHIE